MKASTTTKRILTIILLAMCRVGVAYGIVATPEPVMRQLPDWSWQQVYLRGDENYHYLTTLEGTMIAGTEVYTPISTDDVRDEMRQNKPSASMIACYVPRQGKVRIPVFLVNFTDEHFTMDDPVNQFSDFFNGSGGTNPNATGSVHDYYIASSDSALSLEYDVYGPYTLSNPMAYYGGNSGSSHYKNIQALIEEATSLAVSDGVDMSLYDNNNDGYIDNISIISAGYNEAEGGSEDCIWPHYNILSSSKKYSGKYLSGYLIISEYRSSGGKVQAGIGTYCHEFGHALGLPDLYNTKSSETYTIGTWDVMCSGSYNNNGSTPPTYSAYERWVMGWLKPIQLDKETNYQLPPLCQSNTAYLIAAKQHNQKPVNPDPNEFFLLENRQKVGWDANKGALVGTGMMVSHITFDATKWERNTFNNTVPLGYAIEGAYIKTPTTTSASDLFPGTANVTSFLPTLNNGTTLDAQKLTGIREHADGTITFRYGAADGVGFTFNPQSVGVLYSPYDNRIVSYDSARVEIVVKGITTERLRLYISNSNFDIRRAEQCEWVTNGSSLYVDIPSDSIVTIWVRYSPRRQNCSVVTTFLNVETEDASYVDQMEIQGCAPRPTYITTPEVTHASNIASTSFTVHWTPQDDAEAYYITCYSLTAESSTEPQSFDTFSSLEAIAAAGWSSNFAALTSNVAESGRAVYFSQSEQTLLSPIYLLPCQYMRFWISNNYVISSAEETGGYLLIEGTKGDGIWETIDRLRITYITRNLAKTYSFTSDEAYRQFRFSYTHLGGTGGCALDEFEASFAQTVHYICSGTEWELSATTTQAIFTNLQSSTTYYLSVQAYEDKGCEAHYTSLSAPLQIQTLSGDGLTSLYIHRTSTGEYIALLPESSDGWGYVNLYNQAGKLVCSHIAIPYGSTQITLPVSALRKGNIYIAKLIKGSMKRNSAAGKFLYY